MMLHTRAIDAFPSLQRVIFTNFGYLLLLYVLSFLVFAVIRVLTGVSIKRLGYFSLRHVSFTPRAGVHVSVGKLGISIHRPSVARPGWFSLYMNNFDLTLDSKVVLHPEYRAFRHKPDHRQPAFDLPESTEEADGGHSWPLFPNKKTVGFQILRYIVRHTTFVNFSATSTSITYTGVGTLILGSANLKIDMRTMTNALKSNFVGTLDTRQEFNCEEIPAALRLSLQDFYIAKSLTDEDARDFLDLFDLEVIGILNRRALSFKDISVSLKLGKTAVYLDTLFGILESVKTVRREIAMAHPREKSPSPSPPPPSYVLSDHDVKTLTKVGALMVQLVKEVEFKAMYVAIFDLTAGPRGMVDADENAVKFAARAKDLSLDLRRLNPKSPGFKLFFSENDSAHQAIFAISSVSFGIDDDARTKRSADELVYIPMVTMISKTNIFSKTLKYVRDDSTFANESVFRANINITSPTVDLATHHVPLILRALSRKDSSVSVPAGKGFSLTAESLQRLYPRTAIKFTIDEPAARILLLPSSKSSKNQANDDDTQKSMVISSSSKIHCNFESSHSNDEDNMNYSLDASLQISSYDTWYRSPSGIRYDVFLSEDMFLKFNAVMNPKLSVNISGVLSNANVLLTKREVFKGVRELFLHLKNIPRHAEQRAKNPNKLQQLPPWISKLKIEIANTAVSVASDHDQSGDESTRGLTLQMTNSVLEYKCINDNRRKLAIIMEGIEGYKIIEPYELAKNDLNRFLQAPALSVSLATTRPDDLKCNVNLNDVLLKYDINLHFLSLLAVGLLGHTFALDVDDAHGNLQSVRKKRSSKPPSETQMKSILECAVKTGNIRIKIELPNNVHAMLETNNLEVHKKAQGMPKCRAKAIRLYSMHPHIPRAYCRLISLKGAHAMFKNNAEGKHSSAGGTDEEDILLQFDGMRVNTPNQFITHLLLDNSVTLFKAIINLQGRYRNDDEFYEAVSRPKERNKMPNIPKVRIKSPVLLLSMEDDHFESQLGLIFQVGMREQKKRFEKERAFEAKVDAIMSARSAKSAKSAALRGKQSVPQLRRTHPSLTNLKSGHTSSSSINSEGTDEETRKIKKAHTFGSASLFSHKSSHTEVPGDVKKRRITPSRTFMSSLHRRRKSHYKMTAPTVPSETSKVTVEEARNKMQRNFSTCWIRAFNKALKAQRAAVKENIERIWGQDQVDQDTAANERIVDYSSDPLLFYAFVRNMDLLIRKPQFDDQQLRQFLHNVGKGLPLDTRFTLLVPLYFDLKAAELRCEIRDYPLPLLHFPELAPSQDQSLTSIKLSGNFVLAEELWLDEGSIRRINVPLVPHAVSQPESYHLQKYIIEVIRTVSSVKMYTELNTTVSSINPTRITWANSIQPAIQTIMQAFDSFSKPPIDPSPKLGFWDKIRYIFHARLTFNWAEGDVFLLLKGSRSPYELLSEGAGFLMGWRNNVVLRVNHDDNPKELLIVDSEEYIMAVPNYAVSEQDYLKKECDFRHALMSVPSFQEVGSFSKVIMKLSGKVQWVMGLLFEMDKPGSMERTSDFKPHYEVQLTKPQFIEAYESHDAYKGFRSQYVHMAIAVTSPEIDERQSYNTAHLSPKVIHHFLQWWGLFDGSLSLPTKAGNLFQASSMKKPKFSRHLFTVKYKLLLSPLYFAHNYRHPRSDNLTKHNKQASTGLKAKIDSFVMDLHQRREEEKGKRWKMKTHMGEFDFQGTDMRVILGQFKERSPQELLAKQLDVQSENSPGSSSYATTEQHTNHSATTSQIAGHFKISDNDLTWIDMDDYVELDENIPIKNTPKIVVLPLIYTPRWTYIRQTDHSGKTTAVRTDNGKEYIKFGNEPVHDCLIGKSHPEVTQHMLLRDRISELEEQLKTDDATLDSLLKDLQVYPGEPSIEERVNLIKQRISKLERRRQSLLAVLSGEFSEADAGIKGMEEMVDPKAENKYNNRFMIHNIQLKWNNAVRNAVYRYLHKVGDRRAYSYFITRKAIKYVEDMIAKSKSQRDGFDNDDAQSQSSENSGESPTSSTKEQVEKALGTIFKGHSEDKSESDQQHPDHPHSRRGASSRRIVSSDGSENAKDNFQKDLRTLKDESLSCTDSYLVKLSSPQIQLVSDQNSSQCVMVTSRNIELNIISVIDANNEDDEVSGLVETRYGVLLEDAQFFVLSQADLAAGSVMVFGTNSYGCEKAANWPPWLALEICYDSEPLSSQLVVSRTTATLRYDKPNSLRVQQIASRSGSTTDRAEFNAKVVRCENYRSNRVTVDFPKVVATCDSEQYFAVYTIAVDLLVYSEPGHQKTSERLEEVLLATDFSDLDGAVEKLNQLQRDIQQLEDLRNEFYVRLGDLEEQASEDLMKIEVEYQHVVLELVVMMRAIRTGLQRGHKKSHDNTSMLMKWSIAADQIIWHVLGEDRKPFLDIGLADASFNRIESDEGYNSNTVEVGMMQGFNLLPNALYPEMFSPYVDNSSNVTFDSEKLIYVEWTLLDPIGGIPIMDYFYVKLLPLKVQLEHDTGQKVFEYIFPASSETESPFVVNKLSKSKNGEEDNDNDDDDDDDDVFEGVVFSSGDNMSIVNNTGGSSTISSDDPSDMESISTSSSWVKNPAFGGAGGPVANRALRQSSSFANGRFSSNLTVSNKKGNNRDISPGSNDASSFLSAQRANKTTSLYSFSSQKHSIGSAASQKHGSGSAGTSHHHHHHHGKHHEDEKTDGDDFAVMVKRASNYMSIVDIKIDSTTLCVSYKGQGHRNLTDIHEFVIRLPGYEYKNKMWSNLDLALRLKKDVIKTLFQHTGALISNKFTKHRKRHEYQPLRQISNYVSFTSVSDLTDPRAKQSVANASTASLQERGPSRKLGKSRSTTSLRNESSKPSDTGSANREGLSTPLQSSAQEHSSPTLKARATSFVKGIVNSNNSSSALLSPVHSINNNPSRISEDVEGEMQHNDHPSHSSLPSSPLQKLRRKVTETANGALHGEKQDEEQSESTSESEDDVNEEVSESEEVEGDGGKDPHTSHGHGGLKKKTRFLKRMFSNNP
ncbi:hypothetical protein TRVA0_001S03136 [Trichomonascus vanleenenianus]|uniref:uncharacterized protein n=1 Tax=Trichomonascus vanleenenianus TaxID=2268995 RepID=UPI003ECAEC93